MSSKLKVDVNSLRGFSVAQRTKINSALDLLIKILNSQEFKNAFLKLTFTSNEGRSNEQIYSMLMSGGTDLGPTDGDLDIDLTYYYSRWSRVIGYGLPNTIRTWINGKFLNSMNVYELAGHLGHEYTHKLGFIDPAKQQVLSVPYQTGYLIERLGKQFVNGDLILSDLASDKVF